MRLFRLEMFHFSFKLWGKQRGIVAIARMIHISWQVKERHKERKERKQRKLNRSLDCIKSS